MADVRVTALPVQANARCLPLRDESVDLLISSPPYFSLRSYRDSGEHFEGQIGSEATPQAFLEALWAVMSEAWRVLKPTGSCFINLGDKRSGSGGHNNAGIAKPHGFHVGTGRKLATVEARAEATMQATRRNAPDRYTQAAFGRPKSKMLLPHRFAIGCEDGLADPDGIGWIVRQDIVWSKPNGLPESVTDRVRDSHEFWFHLTKQGRYFSAVDEVREPHNDTFHAGRRGDGQKRWKSGEGPRTAAVESGVKGANGYSADWEVSQYNPLGKLPGSVWSIPSEPLTIPEAVKAHYNLPDHFAAFPQEWPRRLILGWSPSGVCVACGEGRRPVVAKALVVRNERNWGAKFDGEQKAHMHNRMGTAEPAGSTEATITGYACACPDASAPTRPSVVADVFGGTGTVAGVARQLGRIGLSFDLSHDYSRLAAWFLRDGRRFAKTSTRTDRERQGVML